MATNEPHETRRANPTDCPTCHGDGYTVIDVVDIGGISKSVTRACRCQPTVPESGEIDDTRWQAIVAATLAADRDFAQARRIRAIMRAVWLVGLLVGVYMVWAVAR